MKTIRPTGPTQKKSRMKTCLLFGRVESHVHFNCHMEIIGGVVDALNMLFMQPYTTIY